jgi:hypothetical protein
MAERRKRLGQGSSFSVFASPYFGRGDLAFFVILNYVSERAQETDAIG